jgi:hypothetical protein
VVVGVGRVVVVAGLVVVGVADGCVVVVDVGALNADVVVVVAPATVVDVTSVVVVAGSVGPKSTGAVVAVTGGVVATGFSLRTVVVVTGRLCFQCELSRTWTINAGRGAAPDGMVFASTSGTQTIIAAIARVFFRWVRSWRPSVATDSGDVEPERPKRIEKVRTPACFSMDASLRNGSPIALHASTKARQIVYSRYDSVTL